MSVVACLGAYDPGYPRNRIVRAALGLAGHTVLEARVPDRRAFRRWPRLVHAWARLERDPDVVFVPEFRHKDVAVARLLAGSRPLVFDPLVSRWDTLVGDWRLHAPDSAQARWNRTIDRIAFAASDRILCDTWAHGELFAELGAERSRLRRVLVGAEATFFDVPSAPTDVPVRILYVGGFLPLHGVGTMLDAFARLAHDPALRGRYEVVMVGDGIEYAQARAQAERDGLANVTFAGRLSYADLPGVIADAHVVLGAFGVGAKTGRVIPHKLWQGLAAGRAVVTGDGPGPREVFVDGRDLLLVPRGDGAALAAALGALVTDPARRTALGAAGRAAAHVWGHPSAIAGQLREAFAGLPGMGDA